jgi:hypothetical protein
VGLPVRIGNRGAEFRWPTGIITRGYQLHGVRSFFIRRAELHAWPEPFLSIAHRLSVLTPAFEAIPN